MKKIVFLILLLSISLFLSSCHKNVQKIQPISFIDTHFHHYEIGMNLLDRGDLGNAEKHLKRAILLKSDYSPAYSGLAVLYSIYYKNRKNETLLNLIKKFFKKAKSTSKSKENLFVYYISQIRVLANIKPQKWLKKSEKFFKKGIKLRNVDYANLHYYNDKTSIYYFMAMAYLEAHKPELSNKIIKKAVKLSKQSEWIVKILELNKKVEEIILVQNFLHTITNDQHLYNLPYKDYITRVEFCVLINNFLKLQKLEINKNRIIIPLDIINSPFKEEIISVLKLHFRGLKLIYDNTHHAYLFKPEKKITKIEIAFIIEDLLRIIEGKDYSKIFYSTEHSPFKDISPYSPYFNVAMLSVIKGFLSTENGFFNPYKPISGRKLVWILMKIRDKKIIKEE